MECENHKILNLLYPALDRLNETAWYIRLMEENYHSSDKFRWALNGFLRALNEVHQILQKQIETNKEINRWFREARTSLLNDDELIKFCTSKRNEIVHQKMLMPHSKVSIGFTRGKGLKIGMSIPANPADDSYIAILKYINFVSKRENKDFLGILYTEEDGSGEYTCVERVWRLDKFPDDELTELAAKAWNKMAALLTKTANKLNAEIVELEFQLADPFSVRYQIYSPNWIKEQITLAKEDND